MFSEIVTTASGLVCLLTLLSLLIKPVREWLLGAKEQKDGIRCLLRAEIVRLYYKHQDSESLQEYEWVMLDACYQAKRARELLPALPKGVTSSYIQYLDAIERLECEGVRVKVSDISDALHLPRPGVTRTIGEMEDKGYLQKSASAEDGRVTYLTITEQGRKLSQTFNEQFFAQLAPLLDDISDEDAECTIRTIRALYDVMAERRITLVH